LASSDIIKAFYGEPETVTRITTLALSLSKDYCTGVVKMLCKSLSLHC